MNDDFLEKSDSGGPNPEAPYVPGVVVPEQVEADAPDIFQASPEAVAAAEAAIGEFKDRSFAGRNAELGKMVNCPVCHRRHRRTDVAIREHYDGNGKLPKTIEPLITECKQEFKQLWVEQEIGEDGEEGPLSIQYATVPIPGQGRQIDGKTVFANEARPIVGAAHFNKKRKSPRPNHTGLDVVFHTRRLFALINPETYPAEAERMLAAKRVAVNTVRNKRERTAAKKRKQQKLSRRINRSA